MSALHHPNQTSRSPENCERRVRGTQPAAQDLLRYHKNRVNQSSGAAHRLLILQWPLKRGVTSFLASTKGPERWPSDLASGNYGNPTLPARAIAARAKAVTRPKRVDQRIRFDLSINRGTAGKFGLATSPGLLAEADDVIE